MDLTEQVALVTGASSGIGEATARALAREECTVVLAARRRQRLETVAGEIEADDGNALVVPTDVTDEDDVVALVDATRDAFDGIDILVNNAGVIHPDTVADADRDDFRQQVEVNLLGVMNVTHAALPDMLASGGGDVVVVSSLNARYPSRRAPAYTATKSGVNGFCRALRKDVVEDGIRVTTVMPGPVVTEINDWEEWDGRALDPGDVAEVIVFAVSRPEYISLREIPVNAVPLGDAIIHS